jgi:shikimate kinase
MSGTGKSAIVAALGALGRRAVDLDSPAYSHWVEVEHDDAPGTPVEPGRDWVWREDAVRELLQAEPGGELFASGCAANMEALVPSFDLVVLLSAPTDELIARLAQRAPGAYGSERAERERVVALIASVEPHLRRVASHELDTSGSVEDSVAALLELVEEHRGGGAS